MRVRSSQMVTSERSGEVCWSLQNSGPASRKTWRMANLRREVKLVHRAKGEKNKRLARRTVLLTVLAYGLVPRMQLRVPRIEALQCPLEPFASSTHTAHLLQHR